MQYALKLCGDDGEDIAIVNLRNKYLKIVNDSSGPIILTKLKRIWIKLICKRLKTEYGKSWDLYNKARDKEMLYFDLICWYCHDKGIKIYFAGITDLLDI